MKFVTGNATSDAPVFLSVVCDKVNYKLLMEHGVNEKAERDEQLSFDTNVTFYTDNEQVSLFWAEEDPDLFKLETNHPEKEPKQFIFPAEMMTAEVCADILVYNILLLI